MVIGDEQLMCEAIFDVTDAVAAKRRLAAQPHLEPNGDGFVWHELRQARQAGGRGRKRKLVAGARIFGRITFRDSRMVLETRSRRELELGKTMLEALLAGLLHHRVDTIEDLDFALAEHGTRDLRLPGDDEVPREVRAEIMTSVVNEELVRWADEPSLDLAGATPREACKTKRGREQVVALLRERECLARDLPGGDQIDFSVVYLELGLR